jgi:hypothetical protein
MSPGRALMGLSGEFSRRESGFLCAMAIRRSRWQRGDATVEDVATANDDTGAVVRQ